MAVCTPTYSRTDLPVDPTTCGSLCAGVTFTVSYVNSSCNDSGSCVFEWKVVRDKGGVTTDFADVTTVPCPGAKTVTFYCTNAKVCARMQLNFMCEENGEG